MKSENHKNKHNDDDNNNGNDNVAWLVAHFVGVRHHKGRPAARAVVNGLHKLLDARLKQSINNDNDNNNNDKNERQRQQRQR